MGDDVQAKLGGSAFTGQRGPGGVGGRQAGAFGVAGHRASFGVRQVFGQPALALRQGLRVGQHHFDVIERTAGAQQIVAYQQTDFTDHMGGGVQEKVQRTGDHAFGGVLHPNHAILRAAGRSGVKDFVKVRAIHQVGCATKKFNGGLFAEGALGAQHGHTLWRFQRQACRHDLAPDGGHMRAFERARVGRLNLVDDLCHAVRAKKGRALAFFDFSHMFGHLGPLVQQCEQLLVDAVDLHAQAGEVGGGLGSIHG